MVSSEGWWEVLELSESHRMKIGLLGNLPGGSVLGGRGNVGESRSMVVRENTGCPVQLEFQITDRFQ